MRARMRGGVRLAIVALFGAAACGPQVADPHGETESDAGEDVGSSSGDADADGTSSPGPVTTVDPEPFPPGEASSDPTLPDPTGATTGVTTDDPSLATTGPVPACGDGQVDPGEQCDGMDLDGWDCEGLGLGQGTLGCELDTCTFDTSMCGGHIEGCGDGQVGPGEQCDLGDLDGFDCESLGLGEGVLACNLASCSFDTSGCQTCGDGVIDPGEQCDGDDLQGFDCDSLGLGSGTLACDPILCAFDTSMCSP